MGLIVAASGQIDLAPQQGPGQYVSGPDGSPRAGNVGVSGTGYAAGTLLGRVGERGPVFVVGRRYEGSPGQEGRLYLCVAKAQDCAGSYQVKLTAGVGLVPEKKVSPAGTTSSTSARPSELPAMPAPRLPPIPPAPVPVPAGDSRSN
jgi:hypothetical protein